MDNHTNPEHAYLAAGNYWVVYNMNSSSATANFITKKSVTGYTRKDIQATYGTAFPASGSTWSSLNSGYASCLYFVGVPVEGYAKATKATLPAASAITSLSFYTHATGNFRLAIYSDSSGAPGAKQWESGDTAAAASAWNTVNISAGTPTSLTLAAGTYWLAWQWNSANSGPSYASGSANTGDYLAQAYGAFPAPWSGGTLSTENWSLYGIYSSAPATKLVITSTAVTTTAGVASSSITVQRQDQFGNPDTTDGAITLTLSSTSSGTVTFNPASPQIASGSSSVTFTYTDTKSGTPTITAQSGSLTSGTQQETVNPGALDHFAVSNPGTVTAGTAFTTTTITAQDANNNTVTGYTGTVDLTETGAGAGGTVSPATTGAFSGGVLANPSLTLTKAATSGVTLTAIDHGGTKTGVSGTFAVNAGALDHFVVSNPGTVTAGTAFTTTTITAQDANNNTVTGYTGTVDLTETGAGAGGTVSPATTGAFSGGVLANPSLTLTKAATSGVTLTAIDHGGTKTGVSGTFAVNAGALDHFVVSNPGTVTAGTAFTTTTITAQDANNNTVTGYTGTVDLTETGAGAGGTVSPATTGAFSGGVLANPSLTLTKAATSGVTLTATDHGGTKTGVSGTFAVNPGVLDHFVVSNPGTVTAGTAFTTTTITAQDANNNTVTGYTGTVDLTETGAGAGGTVSPATTGAFSGGVLANPSLTLTKAAASGVTLTATDHGGTKTGVSGAFAVNPGAASKLLFTTSPAGAIYKTAFTTQPVVKTYDANGNLSTSGLGSSVMVTVSLTTGTGPLAGTTSLDIGTGAGNGTVSYSGLQINKAENGDVLTASATGFTSGASSAFNVGQATLTVTATGVNKVYDGGTAATVTLSDNHLGSDVVTESYTSATFADKTVATGKTVSVSGISISGGTAAANYSLGNTTASTTANITVRTLTVSATGLNKVYDGTTAATVTLSDNHLGSDVVTESYTSATFADKAVGTGKTVSVSGISISGGTDAANYSLGNTTASTTANISKATLTVSATGQNKVYDGGTAATVTLSDNHLGSDVVTESYTSATFADKNVATGKTVSVSGISISGGTDAGNYSLGNTTASTTANISKATLTVSATGVNKTYDGTTAATVTLSDNHLGGDVVTESYTSASFADKAVATGKTVSVSGISISGGTDAGNYSLGNTTASTTANISKATLTVSATGVNKTYDGTTAATVTLSDNHLGSDVVTESYTGASFADKNVGTGKTVSVSGISISGGTDAANYNLGNTTASTTASITAASTANAVVSSLNPALPGSNVTFTATLSAVPPGAGTPTGTVQFLTNGVAVGGPVALASGQASFATALLPHGSNTVVAQYAGDGNFLGQTNALSPSQVVNTPPVHGTFTLGTIRNQYVDFSATKLAKTATDADHDPLSITAVVYASAQGGTAVLNGATIRYTPPSNYVGADTLYYTVSDSFGGSDTSGTIAVTVRYADASSALSDLTELPDGNWQVSASGVPTYTYQIQATTNTADPASWVTLGTQAADSNGIIVFSDLTATNYSQRFYRLAAPAP